MNTAEATKVLMDKHVKVEKIMCRAETYAPVTAKHEFSGGITSKVLRCTRRQHTEGFHRDAACCYNFHQFDRTVTSGPKNVDESFCQDCHESWPCHVAVLLGVES